MPVTRHVLDPHRPLIDTVGDFLLPGTIDGPVSLADTLVLVPTRQSGRRLREHLARQCATVHTALLDATITLPHTLFRPHTERPVASAMEVATAWCEAIRHVDPLHLPALFPNPPESINFAWVLGQAEAFMRLREQLSEIDLSIGDVPDALGEALPGAARWRDLDRLERTMLGMLDERGIVDPDAAKREAANHPTLPPGITRIVLAGLPDPPGLALRALEILQRDEHLRIDILIPCTAGALDLFDAWGRPLSEAWCSACPRIPDAAIHLAGTPEQVADEAFRHLSSWASTDSLAPDDLAIAAADLVWPLADRFEQEGLSSLDPAGVPIQHTSLFPLVQHLIGLRSPTRFSDIQALLRHPLMLRFLARSTDSSQHALLRALDELHQNHLPVDLDAGLALAPTGKPLHAALQLLTQFRDALFNASSGAAQELRNILLTVLDGVRIDPNDPDQARLREATELLNGLIDDVAALTGSTPGDEQLTLLRKALGEAVIPADETNKDLLLEGWLEMPWNPAPALLVAGFNEGAIPDGRIDDPFLPDRLRAALGLRSDATRHARDTYLLTTLLQQRQPEHVCLIAARSNTRGDTLKPSRLLFQGVDSDTRIARVKALFQEPPSGDPPPARSPVFALDPGHLVHLHETGIERLSVTDFRSYLACPFRFFLRKTSRLDTYNPEKSEPDASDYGSMLHAVLCQFGKVAAHSSWTDPHAIESVLRQYLETYDLNQYGKHPSLAIRYAVHSAGERLGAFSRAQAELAEEGWRIVACEHKIELPFAHGITLSGTIDRIDRHANGTIRVIDYKTGESADGPEKSHFASVPKDRDLPEWAAIDLQTDPAKAPKWKAWADLQLPLYAWCVCNDPALQKLCGTGPIETGYIALPKALTHTGWLPFDTESDALRDAAITCAEHIAAAVQAREFWPPAPSVKYDDLAPWLHHGLDHDIAPEQFLAWMEAHA